MKRALSVGTVVIALLSIAAPARASLIGDSVLIEALFPDLATVVGDDVVLVGTPAAELVCPAALGMFEICDTYYGSNLTSLNIEAFSIRQDYGPNFTAPYSPAVFNGHRFSDLDFGGGAIIIGFVLLTDIAGLNAARISFTADSITINLQGLAPAGASFWRLTLETSDVAVPEPMSLLLVGSGIVALGWRRRKSQSR